MDKKTILLALILITVFIIYGCSDNESDGNNTPITPVLLLPFDNDINGWVSFGAYEEANDYDSLYNIIGKTAQTYIDNGFISGVFQEYIDSTGKGTIYVRIYDHGEESNASMIYNKIANGIGVAWNGAGTEARIDEAYASNYIIEFWQKNFFVQVITDEKTADALSIAKLFATEISKNIS